MNVLSLSGFFSITGAKFRLFDLGTQVRKLPEQILNDLDEGKPYPYPHLGYGWLVIFIWNPQFKEQNSFWFLKMPLDEQGILSAAMHSDLVNRLYKSLQEKDAKERQRLLNDHPYQFQPDAEKMAALHARATKQLGLPASPYFEAADQFYHLGQEIDWQSIGVQGIADLICRADDDTFANINKQLKNIPQNPAMHLIRQLEHRDIPASTAETLLAIAQTQTDNHLLVDACIRGASQAKAKRLFDDFLLNHLANESLSIESLLLLITRYTYLLDRVEVATQVLDQLAKQADFDGFQRVVTNLALQPGMKNIVRTVLSSDTLTENLANALSQMIQLQRNKHAQK